MTLVVVSLPCPYVSTASFYVVGSCGETIVSSSAHVVGSCVATTQPPIVGSCGATRGILGVATLVYLLEQLLFLLILDLLGGFELWRRVRL
jgi:hypothetical protein